jgi:hypothetical protein
MPSPAGGQNVFRPTVKPTGKHTKQAENVTTVKSGQVTGEMKTYIQNNPS